MAILAFNSGTTGLVGSQINPRRGTMVTTDSLSTITTAGYLNNQYLFGATILPTDIYEVLYSFNESTQVGTYGIFQVTYSGGNWTMNIWENPANVLLPVLSGNFAMFNGTSGQITDLGITPSNPNYAYASMVDGSVNIGNVASFIDENGSLQDEGIDASAILESTVDNPDPNSNIFVSFVQIGFAQLSGGASTTILSPSGSKSYQILDARIAGTLNFSGGGGDRNGRLVIGATNYSVIPDSTLQALTNNSYILGTTAFPFPTALLATAPITLANPLTFSYEGGTTDYTSGTIGIQITFLRTA